MDFFPLFSIYLVIKKKKARIFNDVKSKNSHFADLTLHFSLKQNSARHFLNQPCEKMLQNQVWYIPAMPALGKLRQEDCEFKASLGYIVSASQPILRYIARSCLPVSKKTQHIMSTQTWVKPIQGQVREQSIDWGRSAYSFKGSTIICDQKQKSNLHTKKLFK
jgi:hypothetical protein